MTDNLTTKDFYGPGTQLPADALVTAATTLGVEPEVLAAIVYKESSGNGFLPDGRPKILFEPYQFHRLTKGIWDKAWPQLSVMAESLADYGPGGAWQWNKLGTAMSLDEGAALEATSWGFWQCMGFNYALCGYSSVQAMVRAFVSGEPAQLGAFVCFLRASGLVPAMQAKDWATIAYRFNGPKYRENHYDTDLQKFYQQRLGYVARLGSTGPLVVNLQKLLNAAYDGPAKEPTLMVDGVFGATTEEALKVWQAKKGLVVDGVAGPQVFSSLATSRIETTTRLGSKRVAGATIGAGAAIGTGVASVGGWNQLQDATTKATQYLTSPDGQHATTTMKQVFAQSVAAGDGAHIVIAVLVLITLVQSGYIVWTKLVDYAKLTAGQQ